MGFGSYDEDDHDPESGDEDDDGEVVTDDIKGEEYEGEARTEVPDDTSQLVDQLAEMKDGDDGETEGAGETGRWAAEDAADDPAGGAGDDAEAAGSDAEAAESDPEQSSAAASVTAADGASEEQADGSTDGSDDTATPAGSTDDGPDRREADTTDDTEPSTEVVETEPPAELTEELAESLGLDGVDREVAAALATVGVETVEDLRDAERADLATAPGVDDGLATYVDLLSDRAGERTKRRRLADLADVDGVDESTAATLESSGFASESDFEGVDWRELTRRVDRLGPDDAVAVRASVGEGPERRAAATILAVAAERSFEDGSEVAGAGVETPADATDADPETVAERSRVDAESARRAIETLRPAVELGRDAGRAESQGDGEAGPTAESDPSASSERSDGSAETDGERRSGSAVETVDRTDDTAAGTGSDGETESAGVDWRQTVNGSQTDDDENETSGVDWRQTVNESQTDADGTRTTGSGGSDSATTDESPGQDWSFDFGDDGEEEESTGAERDAAEAEHPETGASGSGDGASEQGGDETDTEESTSSPEWGARRGDDDAPTVRTVEDLSKLYRVGDGLAERLAEKFGDLEGIAAADDEEIDDITGIGRTMRVRITGAVDRAFEEGTVLEEPESTDAEGDDEPDDGPDDRTEERGSEETEGIDPEEPLTEPGPIRERVERHLALKPLSDGIAYAKASRIANKMGRSTRDIGRRIREIREDDAAPVDMEQWGGKSNSNPTWMVETPYSWYADVDGVSETDAAAFLEADIPPWELLKRGDEAVVEETDVDPATVDRLSATAERYGTPGALEWAVRGESMTDAPVAKERLRAELAEADEPQKQSELVERVEGEIAPLRRNLRTLEAAGIVDRTRAGGTYRVELDTNRGAEAFAQLPGVGAERAPELERAELTPQQVMQSPARRLVRVPGIDVKTATDIAASNGNDPETLENVDGVGPNRAATIRERRADVEGVLDPERLKDAPAEAIVRIEGIERHTAEAVAREHDEDPRTLEAVDGVVGESAETFREAADGPDEFLPETVETFDAERIARVEGIDPRTAGRIARENENDPETLENVVGFGETTAEALRDRAADPHEYHPADIRTLPAERLVRIADEIDPGTARRVARENGTDPVVLEGIDRVGPQTAAAVREEYDHETLREATAEDLYATEDVGRAQAKRIADAFDNVAVTFEDAAVAGVGDEATDALRAHGVSVEEARTSTARELNEYESVTASMAREIARANGNDTDVSVIGPEAMAAAESASTTRERIERLVEAADGTPTQADVAEALDERRPHVSRTLSEMADEGRIDRHEDGQTYRLELVEEYESSIETMDDVPGVGDSTATSLAEAGFDPEEVTETPAERLVRVDGVDANAARRIARENDADDELLRDIDGLGRSTAAEIRAAFDYDETREATAEAVYRETDLNRQQARTLAAEFDNETTLLDDEAVGGVGGATADALREHEVSVAEARTATAEELLEYETVTRRMAKSVARANGSEARTLEDVPGLRREPAAALRDAGARPDEVTSASAERLARVDDVSAQVASNVAATNGNDDRLLGDVDGLDDPVVDEIRAQGLDVTPADLEGVPAERLADLTARQLYEASTLLADEEDGDGEVVDEAMTPGDLLAGVPAPIRDAYYGLLDGTDSEGIGDDGPSETGDASRPPSDPSSQAGSEGRDDDGDAVDRPDGTGRSEGSNGNRF